LLSLTAGIVAASASLLAAGPARARGILDVVYTSDDGEYAIEIGTIASTARLSWEAVSLYRTDTGARMVCSDALGTVPMTLAITLPPSELPIGIQARAHVESDCSDPGRESLNSGVAWLASTSQGAAPSPDQVRCVYRLNADVAKLVNAQSVRIVSCMTRAANGNESDPDACVLDDGQFDRLSDRLRNHARQCAQAPDFGAASAERAIAASRDHTLAVYEAAFGPLQTAVVRADRDQALSRCQLRAARYLGRCLSHKMKAYADCAKRALKGRLGGVPGRAIELERLCLGMGGSGLVDLRGKVDAACVEGIQRRAVRFCAAKRVRLPDALGGPCAVAGDTAACLAREAACGACRALNTTADLGRDCDRLDNGLSDGSCD